MLTGGPLEPGANPLPAGAGIRAASRDRRRVAWVNGDSVVVRCLDSAQRQEAEESALTLEWHLRQAAEAEQQTQWFAAVFHLKQALRQQPGNGDLRARQEKAESQRKVEPATSGARP